MLMQKTYIQSKGIRGAISGFRFSDGTSKEKLGLHLAK
jgi:hypothetical protein